MGYNPNASGTPNIARSTAKSAVNNTGSLIPKLTPVRLATLGMQVVDISNEIQIDGFAGITRGPVANGAQGEIVNSGVIDDISVSYGIGETLYVAKSGGVTNIKPSVGVSGFTSGDFVIRLGVVAPNTNPAKKDLLVQISIIGQL